MGNRTVSPTVGQRVPYQPVPSHDFPDPFAAPFAAFAETGKLRPSAAITRL